MSHARRLIMIALALLAVRMAARALRRAGGDYAQVMAALWAIAGQLALAGTANTAKTRNIEDRLNLLVPRIPVPQSQPVTGAGGGTSSGGNSSYSATNSSYSTTNGSYSMGSTVIGYNPQGSSNDGGNSSSTSGQIGGASAHYHSMTHYHTSSSDLQNLFNALQGSYSSTVPAVNALQGSYSGLVPAVNALQGSYSTTISSLNNLASDHNQLVADHNALKAAVVATGLLH
jgi:hypothetical protein